MSLMQPIAPPRKRFRPTERHVKVSRALGYALTLNDAFGWQRAETIFAHRLEQAELVGLAFASLRALEPAVRAKVFTLVHWGDAGGSGPPQPALSDTCEEAREWASLASNGERRAYLTAAYLALPPRARADFLDYARGVPA